MPIKERESEEAGEEAPAAAPFGCVACEAEREKLCDLLSAAARLSTHPIFINV